MIAAYHRVIIVIALSIDINPESQLDLIGAPEPGQSIAPIDIPVSLANWLVLFNSEHLLMSLSFPLLARLVRLARLACLVIRFMLLRGLGGTLARYSAPFVVDSLLDSRLNGCLNPGFDFVLKLGRSCAPFQLGFVLLGWKLSPVAFYY